MGNTFRPDSYAADVEAIKQDFLDSFADEFRICYNAALVDDIERHEGRSLLSRDYHSYSDPLESVQKDRKFPELSLDFNMKSGYLIKRGHLRKNWKQRYFIARNNAHNYRIEYYDDLEGRLKGSMECYGYKAESFTEDETRTFGLYGIKLVPYDGHRRLWMIRCANEDERGAWLHVFHTACCLSQPPRLETNHLMVSAFSRCYDMLQQRYDMYKQMGTLVGTEIDILVDLCECLLREKILKPQLDDVAPNTQIRARAAFDKYIHASVYTDISQRWQAITRLCKLQHASVEATVRSSLPDLVQERNALLDLIWQEVGSEVDIALNDGALRQVCEPLLARSFPAIEGYIAAEVGFVNQMSSNINSGKFASRELFDKMIAITHKFIQWDTSGNSIVGNAQFLCWKLCSSGLLRVAGDPSQGCVLPDPAVYSAYDFYCDVLDSIRDVAHRAVGSFALRARDRTFVDKGGGNGAAAGSALSFDRAAGTGRARDRAVTANGSRENGQVENNIYHTLKELAAEVESEFKQDVEAAFTILLVTITRRFVNDSSEMRRLRLLLKQEMEQEKAVHAIGRMAKLEATLQNTWLDGENEGMDTGKCLGDFYSLSYLVEECLRAHITRTLFGTVQEYAVRSLYESRNSMMHNV